MNIPAIIQLLEQKKKELNQSVPAFAWQIHHNGGKEAAYDELIELLKKV